jgi:hypothetical protein
LRATVGLKILHLIPPGLKPGIVEGFSKGCKGYTILSTLKSPLPDISNVLIIASTFVFTALNSLDPDLVDG